MTFWQRSGHESRRIGRVAKPVDGQSLLSSILLAAERYAQSRREYEKRLAIRRKFAA